MAQPRCVTGHMVLFGARVYALIVNRKKGTKFHPVASRCYVCRYTLTGYLLYDSDMKVIEPSCNICPHEYTYLTNIVLSHMTKLKEQFTFPVDGLPETELPSLILRTTDNEGANESQPQETNLSALDTENIDGLGDTGCLPTVEETNIPTTEIIEINLSQDTSFTPPCCPSRLHKFLWNLNFHLLVHRLDWLLIVFLCNILLWVQYVLK